MAESWGRDLKPLVDGLFYEIFGFGTFFRYHNFKNKIDAWETTVQCRFFYVSSNGLILNICSHTEATEWFITVVGSFMTLKIALCGVFDWEQPKGFSPLGVFSGVFRQLNLLTDI